MGIEGISALAGPGLDVLGGDGVAFSLRQSAGRRNIPADMGPAAVET
jgi:hypothetical protein